MKKFLFGGFIGLFGIAIIISAFLCPIILIDHFYGEKASTYSLIGYLCFLTFIYFGYLSYSEDNK
jgi:hypothetical protein